MLPPGHAQSPSESAGGFEGDGDAGSVCEASRGTAGAPRMMSGKKTPHHRRLHQTNRGRGLPGHLIRVSEAGP